MLTCASLLTLCVACVTACAKHSMRDATSPSRAAYPEGEEEAGHDDPSGEGGASTWKRSTLTALSSRLTVGDNEALPLASTEIRARVDAFRARVLIDFVFENPYSRQLEGTFQLHLPEGASPYFLAYGQTVAVADPKALQIAAGADSLEPNGAMAARAQLWQEPRQAIMAEREEAAMAYRATVRRKVDPALAEWAGAGVFNARIFPIEPGGTHRVVVGYDVDLTAVGDDLELLLPVPTEAGTVSMELDVGQQPGAEIDVTPSMPAEQVGGRAVYRLERLQAEQVVVRIRDEQDTVLVGEAGGQPFFATRFTPELPSSVSESSKRAAVFAVDTSLSSNPERFEIWRTMLAQILENNRNEIDEFAVMTFSVGTNWWREGFVANTPENVDALMRFTDGLALEGATDVGAALAETSSPTWLEARKVYNTFLLSDGAATWGEADAHAIANRWASAGGNALFAYNTGIPGGATGFLTKLARDSGGAVFSVVGESEVPAASVAHRARPWEIESIEYAAGSDLMLQGRPRMLFPGQRLTLVGRGNPAASTPVALTLRQGEKTRRIDTTIGRAMSSELAARRYGQVAVDQLEDLVTATRPQAVAFARHFRVTGRTCSLVMLETDDDYARAGIGLTEEQDAALVARTEGGKTVAGALAQMGKRLGDPKLRVLEELSRLGSMPGVGLQVREDVMKRIRALPSSSFTVSAEPVRCKPRREDALPQALSAQLRKRQPEYATVVAEAETRRDGKDPDCALVALSSMVEASPGDAVLARDVAFTAASWGMHGQAAQLLQRVARARPYEPITYHALGQTLADSGNVDLAAVFFEVALAGEWDARYGDFKRIVRLDYLRMLRANAGQSDAVTTERAEELRSKLGLNEADLVVTIMWNTDATDVDLHVHEPRGGHVYYGHPKSATGRLTADVTQGYGPEMYVAERAQRGRYQLEAHYYASDANRMSARTKVYATITRGFGTNQETTTRKVITLVSGQETHPIATIRGRE